MSKILDSLASRKTDCYHRRLLGGATIGRLPPGPVGLPFLGSLLELRGNPIQRLRELAVRYGPVLTIKLGFVRIFVLSEVDVIHEALVTQGVVFNDRPSFLGVLSGSGSKRGIVALEYGPFHRYQRQFIVEIMRTLGIGRKKGEKYFKRSLTELCQYLTESDGKPLNARTTVSHYVFCGFFVFLFGFSCVDNESLIELRDSLAEFLHLNPVLILASTVLPKFLVQKFMTGKKKLTDCFLELLQKRRQRYQDQAWPTQADTVWESYLDGIVGIQQRFTKPVNTSSSDDGNHDNRKHSSSGEKAAAALAPDEHFINVLFDFFVVGSETALLGLLWALQMVMLHPQWQRRIQDELDQVVGAENIPSLSHKSRLHVTMATITETYRYRPVSALGAPHRVMQDTILKGHLIPEGSYVLTNIYAAHHDSQRSCPGENWTRSLMFLFTTTILKSFTLTFPDNEELPDPMGQPGINYSPCDFKICATPR
ncbi:cytochrome P450 2D10-like isoform X2 [Acanthaster planci]|uniref:Cytochrome P450 2D10-like isoform X2 n=1 Tax=Acanthaster planci TaxID=133434 RepID=A0A8B7XF32_ACAPL|nr:cytochrome P450 2D10-like isoform X2 [Acanthaster planci]